MPSSKVNERSKSNKTTIPMRTFNRGSCHCITSLNCTKKKGRLHQRPSSDEIEKRIKVSLHDKKDMMFKCFEKLSSHERINPNPEDTYFQRFPQIMPPSSSNETASPRIILLSLPLFPTTFLPTFTSPSLRTLLQLFPPLPIPHNHTLQLFILPS